MKKYRGHRYTAVESFQRLLDGEAMWVAHGDFLDAWKRSEKEDRLELVSDPISQVTTQQEARCAALFAASVIQLCIIDGLLFPEWTKEYQLSEPWYPESRGEKLRQYRRETTPFIFALYNVFGGDDILSRV